ncbi:glucose 1-dehydrogenase [Rhodococcus sp. X156]|uniref:glucose 1-dehydrogenase n=1 Tax=Rhodococcus sp. X156 TaxID=2499145 RepID=UPI000FDA03DF|nr:glucose 1-dehydrogenase [Rhodococcus sp. X156]
MADLAGKVAIITGAAGGQGAAAARRFIEEGAQVMIADIDDVKGAALADELGEHAHYRHLDVGNEEQWADLVEETVALLGKVDVLVNNAGILMFSALADTTLEQYERVIRINQVGTFLGMRSVVKPMTAAGGGSIINTSSIEGLAAVPLLVAYSSSKFAIRGMSKVAAMELGEVGIRVNSVHPGMIDTNMVSTAAGGGEVDLSPAGRKVALRRVGRPEEIAEVLVFLASDKSSYCTGAEFVADGGATATHAFNFAG